jgi:ribosomal-protein-alanine N-acetyltransferase
LLNIAAYFITMLEVNFTPFPTITTERLILRKATLDDAPEILFLRSDPRVLKYIDRAPAQSIDEAINWLQVVIDASDNNIGISWNITLKGADKTIGNIALWRLIKEHYRAEIGYVLHPDHHGKGIMDEAMKAVIDYAFKTMKLHSIEANTNPENKASQNVLERNGFVREAYFREDYYYNGKFLDSAIYCLVDGLTR